MTTLTLVVRPDGRAILAAPNPLTTAQVEQLREAVAGWETGKYPVLVLSDCDVVQIESLELDLEPKPAQAVV